MKFFFGIDDDAQDRRTGRQANRLDGREERLPVDVGMRGQVYCPWVSRRFKSCKSDDLSQTEGRGGSF